MVIINIAILAYLYATFKGVSLSVIRYTLYTNSVWYVFCALIGISYFQVMKENDGGVNHVVTIQDLPLFQGNPPPYAKLDTAWTQTVTLKKNMTLLKLFVIRFFKLK